MKLGDMFAVIILLILCICITRIVFLTNGADIISIEEIMK